jgi:hypothetical protein
MLLFRDALPFGFWHLAVILLTKSKSPKGNTHGIGYAENGCPKPKGQSEMFNAPINGATIFCMCVGEIGTNGKASTAGWEMEGKQRVEDQKNWMKYDKKKRVKKELSHWLNSIQFNPNGVIVTDVFCF